MTPGILPSTDRDSEDSLETTAFLDRPSKTTNTNNQLHFKYDSTDESVPKNAPPILERQSASSDVSVTYLELLRDNSNYRYYWLSYVANHMVCAYPVLLSV
jgi:hypothetical protein